MVKHFFPPDVAGLYAAIALVGRLLYFGAWSIVSAMFPVSAGTSEERQAPALLALPLLMVTGMSAVFVLLLAAFPQLVFRSLVRRAFRDSGSRIELAVEHECRGDRDICHQRGANHL